MRFLSEFVDIAQRNNARGIFTSACAEITVQTTEFNEISMATQELKYVQLDLLKSREEKICFYGNLQNLLTLHCFLFHTLKHLNNQVKRSTCIFFVHCMLYCAKMHVMIHYIHTFAGYHLRCFALTLIIKVQCFSIFVFIYLCSLFFLLNYVVCSLICIAVFVTMPGLLLKWKISFLDKERKQYVPCSLYSCHQDCKDDRGVLDSVVQSNSMSYYIGQLGIVR